MYMNCRSKWCRCKLAQNIISFEDWQIVANQVSNGRVVLDAVGKRVKELLDVEKRYASDLRKLASKPLPIASEGS